MEFIREKTISVVNKDDAVIGDRYIVSDTMENLKRLVKNNYTGHRLILVKDDKNEYIFKTTSGSYALIYPTPHKSYRSLDNKELEALVGEHIVHKDTNEIFKIIGFHHVIDRRNEEHLYYVSLDKELGSLTSIQLLHEYVLHNDDVLGVAIEEE